MEEFDLEEEWKTLGLMLDQFNRLEHLIAKVIRLYVQPVTDHASFVENIILHNSIISFAGKIKLLLTIARESTGPKLNRNKFHRLLNLRNAFAHGNTIKGLRFNRNAFSGEPYGAYLIVETLEGDGSVKKMLRQKAATEFLSLLQELKLDVQQMEQHVCQLHNNAVKVYKPDAILSKE
jgi:hypothetical protein